MDEQWQLALIMEDDAQVDQFVHGHSNTILKEAALHWDILYLGIGNSA